MSSSNNSATEQSVLNWEPRHEVTDEQITSKYENAPLSRRCQEHCGGGSGER